MLYAPATPWDGDAWMFYPHDGFQGGNTKAFPYGHVIAVWFADVLNIYIVTAKVGTGGIISPLNCEVDYGDTITFALIPRRGYMIDSVTGCGGTLTRNTFPSILSSYTTGAITNDCTVSATFKRSFVHKLPW
jgi:hypothetical protein